MPALRTFNRALGIAVPCSIAAILLSSGASRLSVEFCDRLGIAYEATPQWLVALEAELSAASGGMARARILGWLLFGALVFAPITEEFFFRGLVQGWLERRIGRRLLPALVTAALFAACHLTLLHFAALFLVSLCFSVARRLGGLRSAALAHFLYNCASIAALLHSIGCRPRTGCLFDISPALW
ncbi:MAG: CPBP family intramembrane metalloprotease [Kiritimatiellae bacterium]|nr:CPBP family intramembrane metalloprotease [Kiritimatiellia bacterium]